MSFRFNPIEHSNKCDTLFGVVLPLVWIMLDKKGNSNTRERCELWNRFLEIFADRKIDFLTADREFVGEDWFDYLLCDPCTHFLIRIRKNTLLDDGQKQLRADVCFQDLQIGQSKVLSHPRKVWNHSLYSVSQSSEVHIFLSKLSK